MKERDLHIRACIIIVSGICSAFLNTSLLTIICFVKSKTIGKYSYLFFLYTLSALIYSLFQIMVVPTFFASSSGYIMHNMIKFLPRDLATFLVFCFCSCYIQNTIILCLSFVYRYCVMCRQELLSVYHRNSWNLAAVSILVLTYEMAVLVYVMKPNLECDEEFGSKFSETFNASLLEFGYLCAAIWIKNQYNWNLLIPVGSFFVIIIFVGGIITFCVSRILKVLEKTKNQSNNLTKSQKKIFILLLLQLILPFLFNILPVQIVMVSSFLNFDVQSFSQYTGCFLSLSQIIDPILIILFIKPYRVILLRQNTVGSAVYVSHASANRFQEHR